MRIRTLAELKESAIEYREISVYFRYNNNRLSKKYQKKYNTMLKVINAREKKIFNK